MIIPGASEEDAHKSPVKLEVDGQSGKSGKQTSAQTNWQVLLLFQTGSW